MEHSNAFVAIICLPINYFLKNAPSEMYGIALNTHLNSFYFAQVIVLLQYEYTAGKSCSTATWKLLTLKENRVVSAA